MKRAVLLSAVVCLSTADYLSYEGADCAYVYDDQRGATYPLDVCMTDYDATNDIYTSRNYVCSLAADGVTAAIERYTYRDTNCDGTPLSSTGVLGTGNLAYSCGATTSGSKSTTANNEACYLEYKEYGSCTDPASASYQTKYVIVGACVNGPAQYQYSRCDPSSSTVQFVRFNDDACCDLSYSYTGRDAPAWRDYDITLGCDTATDLYINASSWNCLIPEGADDADVFTDNDDPLCTDDAQSWAVAATLLVSIVAAVSIM